ncbi:MAG TPA: RNA polymerase sigma factor [Ktedonobacterales bacterium]|nr:RNA polymerase sigma factor [Ktedonobacterales bacterium]
MAGETDEQLMARAMRGNRAALACLIERYYASVLGYLYRLVGQNRPLAEDLSQEAFLRLLQQETYDARRAFRPWLFAIATNLARDHFKAAATRYTQPGLEGAAHAVIDATPGPEERSLASEQGAAVATAIAQLGEEYRVAILLRFYHGLSIQEISQALDIPPGTVKSRLSVGTRRLRTLLVDSSQGARP